MSHDTMLCTVLYSLRSLASGKPNAGYQPVIPGQFSPVDWCSPSADLIWLIALLAEKAIEKCVHTSLQIQLAS